MAEELFVQRGRAADDITASTTAGGNLGNCQPLVFGQVIGRGKFSTAAICQLVAPGMALTSDTVGVGAGQQVTNALVVIGVDELRHLSTPPYDTGATEEEMIAMYKEKYAALYPDKPE